MKLSIIVPVYNEGQTVAAMLDTLERADAGTAETEIIVVDDGSSDETHAALLPYAARLTIVRHEKNKGKGAAIHTGLRHATGDYTIIQDADLETDPNDIGRIVRHALEHDAPAVYGSRRLSDPSVKRGKSVWYYNLGGTYLTALANILFGLRITDEPVCYKLVRTDLLKSMNLSSERFGFCPEVTAKLARRKVPIREVAISYFPRSAGDGKKIRFKDALEATWVLVKHRFTR